MRPIVPYCWSLLLALVFLLPSANAQLVNYEETWQEFLKNPKTSAISKLTEPSKEQVANYLKYSLMYANSYFCADDLSQSEKMLSQVAAIDKERQENIPGFVAKYEDLKQKVAAYKAADKAWGRYVGGTAVTASELNEGILKEANSVCEKGTLAKYFYMTSMDYYCSGDLVKAKGHFVDRVQKLVDKTSFEPSQVPGMEERVNKMKKVWAAMAKLDPAWAKLVETDVSPGFATEMPVVDCYSIPNMKAYILRAAADVCTVGDEMLKKIKALEKTNTHNIPADVATKIKWLEDAVAENNDGLAGLNKAWKKFLPENKVSDTNYGHEFECDRSAEVKAYIMDGFADPCNGGTDALKEIARVQKEHKPTLDSETTAKLKELKARVNKEKANLTKLNEAWADFLPDDKVNGKLDFPYDYCDKEAQIKAYVMDGTINFCEKGKARLADIEKVRSTDAPELADAVTKKVEALQAKQDESDQDLSDLNDAWELYTSTDKVMAWKEGYPENDDGTVRDNIRLVKSYCDQIAQTKSWVIKGQLDPCEKGEPYLKKIEKLKKDAKLSYDKDLTCQVDRLRAKVYQCKYWALVLQAWQVTYEECERFGPASSEIMRADLNSAEQPCETTVEYQQLGKIGIQYTITTFLCEKINLAKMGDPEYYKKIASWVDREVLDKYCEANMRCKEDFYIYLEGHTDGNRFSGAKYDKSLDIPEGTPYTHFVQSSSGVDTTKKETRNITTDLKSNMELGIARAWTVKQQLDFMNVPITVGAYEHPSSEKGGEYRRIEIELNITNLMLDFYEKTLKGLVDKSGIGNRPKTGC